METRMRPERGKAERGFEPRTMNAREMRMPTTRPRHPAHRVLSPTQIS